MTYTLLIRDPPELFALRNDPALRPALFAPIGAYLKALREAGVFVSGAGLEPPSATTTLVAEGKARWRAEDGPYAEAKEQLAGLFIFEVANHDEALFWARRCPVLPGRVLELRPNLIPLE